MYLVMLAMLGMQAPGSTAPISPPAVPPLPPAVAVDMSETMQISDELLSPFCPGLTLSNCPSPSADSLRKVIQQQLAGGESRKEVIAALVRDYGESILGAPPAKGFNRVLWLAPGAGVLVGMAAIAILASRRRRAIVPAGGAPVRLSVADQARLDEALRDVE